MRRATSLLLLFTIGCGGSPSLSGQQLPAGALGSPAARASFGQSVAILGDEVAIGAPAEDGGARDAGRVHVFDRFDGTLVRTLTSPAPVAAGRFGAAIAADAGLVLVGEPGHGRAHVLDAATGETVVTLAGPGDFGRAVALGGGYACVGVPSRSEVHVFDAATGTLLRTLSRPGALGSALAIAQGQLLAGAPSADRAYVFDLAGGSQILALGGPAGFGAAVAAGGGSWLVAAPEARRAFLYDEEGTLQQTFLGPGFADAFGTGIAYDVDHVIVGGSGGGVPSLFLFDPLTGELVRTIQSTSANEGLSLAALSGVALVGLFPTGTNPHPGVAQTFSCDSGGLLQTFESPGDVPQGALGTSILLMEDGRTAVGAPGEGTGGLVHIFDPDGTLALTIQSPSPASTGGFGRSLASPGQAICIGAPGETGGGRVHMFDATDGTFIQTFVPSVTAAEFGTSISIDGDTLYVGSPGDVVVVQMTVPLAGRVHPFSISTGLAGTPVTSPNPVASGRFGAAVAAFNGSILVGAPGESSGQGAAYRFPGGSATPSVTLNGSTLNAGAFGSAVELTLDEIWVGAPNEDVDVAQQIQTAAGAVHVFEVSKGGFRALLHNANIAQPNARFGSSLSRGSEWMAIGSPGEFANFTQATAGGVVHQYDATTHIRVRKFTSPVQGTNAGGFGTSVSISNSRLVVGAPLEDRGALAPNAGFAYLFDLDAVASLMSPQPQDTGLFGFDLAALDDDTVVIGAPIEGAGQVHLIDPTGVNPTITVPAPDQLGAQFGWSVAILNADFIASAPGANGGMGEVYLFDAGGNLLQTIQSPDTSSTAFGDEIAAVGGNILVGSPLEVVSDVSDVGRAYLFATDGTLLQTFDSPNGEAGGEFGASVANFGGDVLIGAPGENGSAGRAYLFDPNGTLIRTFNGSTVGGGRFGAGVGALDSGTLAGAILVVAVGAPETLAGGTVTTFDQFTGAVIDTLNNPEGFQGESVGFGEMFAEVGPTLAIGSPFGGLGRGRVYFFGAGAEVIGFVESPNAQIGGSFGDAIEGFGGSLLVGAPTEDVNPLAAGRAYVMGIPTQQGPQPDATFVSPSPVPGGAFGASVSFAGGVPVVGAPGEDEGVVYLFDPVTLEPDDALQSPNPVSGALFGASVAANFLQITVGEPGGASGAGRAYLFDATTRLLSLTFDTTSPEQGGLFGASVAVTGANAVVGAPGEDAQTIGNSGRAYYFDCLSETVLQVFESPNPVGEGSFGCAVATAGFDVFVGACNEGAGNVYGFFGLTGAPLGTFPHPDPQGGALFGAALAMLGSDIVVGAPNQAVGPQAVPSGAVYVIDTATGNTLLTLEKPVPASGDLFGTSVAAFGGSIFVGAPGASNGAGEVWEFNASTGDVLASYLSPNPEGGGSFGASLAAISQNFLVGAPAEDGGDADAGVAYLNPPAAQ